MSDINVDMQPGTCKICQVPTKNKCTSCKMVAYCNQEHQKEDWKNHKMDCRPFQVKSSLELGRFLEATRRINAGEILFTESPIVIGPRPEDRVCLGCYGSGPEERCPKCFWPACSPSCPGLTDLNHHGSECLILQLYAQKREFISEEIFKYDVILPLRCLLLQRRNPKNWKILLDMEAHLKKRGPNTDVYKHVQKKIVNYLEENFFKQLKQSETCSKLLPEISPEVLHRICGVIDVNALEVELPRGGPIHALYPTASMMEHNCLPNSRHVFQYQTSSGFKIKVFANQDIQPGSHISTMYTHALWGTQQRQDHLRSTKYFTCRCKRCGDPSELGTNLSGLRCLAPGLERKICGGTQLPNAPLDSATLWKCDKCPTSLTSAQVAELVNMIGGEVDHVLEQNPTVENLQVLLEKLRKLLHSNHYHCYAVMHSLVQLYGRQHGYLPDQINNVTLERKIKMCKQLLAITRAIDPTASRLALYSSVLEQELASAIFILVKRKTWTGDELVDKLKEIKKLLVRARDSLAPEEPESAGSKVFKVISTSLEEFEAFCRLSNHQI